MVDRGEDRGRSEMQQRSGFEDGRAPLAAAKLIMQAKQLSLFPPVMTLMMERD